MVISPSGETVFSGVFGDKEGNNAGNKEHDTGGGGRSNLLYSKFSLAECFDHFISRIVSGEYLTVMRSGDVMIYTDSDTVPGAGFLKLTKTY